MAFEMIELSTKFRKATVGDMLRAVKSMRRLKEGVSQVAFPPLGRVADWKIVVQFM